MEGIRIVARCIYFMPVTPSCDVIDMDGDTWTKFLHSADKWERIRIVLKLTHKGYLRDKVREVAWIPLSENMEFIDHGHDRTPEMVWSFNKYPRTKDEVFKRLDRKLKKSERLELAKAADLSEYHFGLGLWIRNTWCYGCNLDAVFCEDEEERKRKEQLSPLDADRTSEMVLEEYQKYLREKYKSEL